MSVIVGLDLSLTATGMVALPLNWDRNWSRVKARTIVTYPGENALDRLLHIAKCVSSFVAASQGESIFVEDYIKQGFNVGKLAELAGVVKVELRRVHGLTARPVNVSSARKLLIGSVPKGKLAKLIVLEACRSLGAKFEDDAQSDAFAVANYGLSELGEWFVSAA